MKPRIWLVVLSAAVLAGSATPAQTDPADEQAIRRAVQYYFDGSRDADSGVMAKGFLVSTARMLFVRDGQLVEVPIPEFLRRTAQRRTPDFQPDTFPRRVLTIDVAGTSAVAKLETVTPAALVIDYVALLKVGGEWRIVNKIFDRVPR